MSEECNCDHCKAHHVVESALRDALIWIRDSNHPGPEMLREHARCALAPSGNSSKGFTMSVSVSPDAARELFGIGQDDDGGIDEPVGSCDDCGVNVYEENADTRLCDQCEFMRGAGSR